MLFIILGVLSDDEQDLIGQIFTQYHVRLYNLSLHILRSPQDAEDALAQSLLKIMRHINQVKKIPCHELLPFCVVVVRNASIDIHRKRRRSIPTDFLENTNEVSDDTVETLFFKNHERERLMGIVKKLSPDDQYLLELRFGGNMAHKQIAAILNISESTARKRLQRMIERLQKINSEEEHPHE